MKKEQVIEKIEKEFTGKCVDESKSCMYLNEKGQKCAIGLFIPDGHKAQDMDSDVEGLLDEFPSLWDHMPSTNLELLEKFQQCHDGLKETHSINSQKQTLINWVNQNWSE